MSKESLAELVKPLVELTKELVVSARIFICLNSDSNMPRFESSSEFCESVISKVGYNLLKEVDKKAHQVEALFNTTGWDSSEMRGKLDGIKGQLLQLPDHEAASNKEPTWTKEVYA